jgi:predicted kinase
MPKCYQLIGVPGAGKSTWIKEQEWAVGMPVVSTDHFVEEHAKKVGKTYSEIFDEFMPVATKLMVNQALICQANKLDLIWDQTSTTLASRKRKFKMLPDYEHIAVVFKTPDADELARRLANRPGKTIPDHVMRSMIDGFVMPTEDEGFTEIWYAT